MSKQENLQVVSSLINDILNTSPNFVGLQISADENLSFYLIEKESYTDQSTNFSLIKVETDIEKMTNLSGTRNLKDENFPVKRNCSIRELLYYAKIAGKCEFLQNNELFKNPHEQIITELMLLNTKSIKNITESKKICFFRGKEEKELFELLEKNKKLKAG